MYVSIFPLKLKEKKTDDQIVCMYYWAELCPVKTTMIVKRLHGYPNPNMGGSRITGKEVHMYKCVAGSLCCFCLIFLKYPMKIN